MHFFPTLSLLLAASAHAAPLTVPSRRSVGMRYAHALVEAVREPTLANTRYARSLAPHPPASRTAVEENTKRKYARMIDRRASSYGGVNAGDPKPPGKITKAHTGGGSGKGNPTGSKGTSLKDGGSKFVYYSDQFVNGGAPPSPSSIPRWNIVNLGFFMSTGASDMAQSFAKLSSAKRKQVKDEYEKAGIKLMVSAFGGSDAPTTKGKKPEEMAESIANFVKDMDLDGVDVDYEDFKAFSAGTAEKWVSTFTKALREKIGKDKLISHAPIAPWFTDNKSAYKGGGYLQIDKEAGRDIDFYNIQFYNQGNAYENCESILTKSDLSGFEHTSIFEINANGVPLDKLVIGKPGDQPDDVDSGGRMATPQLATCAKQGKKAGWKAGLMTWEFPDVDKDFVSQVWDA